MSIGSPGTEAPQTPQSAKVPEPPSRWQKAITEITTGSVMISILAVILALIVGGILIAVTDPDVQAASTYFFSRPGDMISAIWQSVSGAYVALFQGAVYNFRRPDFLDGIRALTNTLQFATPLIFAGLGVGLAFRVGMFNIGGQGQVLIAAAFAGWVSFGLDLPYGLHLIVAIIAGIIGGAIWAGIAGLLKARTGAHEVIVTIMLNYVAFHLVSYLFTTPMLQQPGSNNPKSPPADPSSVYPQIFGTGYPLRLDFVLAIAITAVIAWLLNRSSLGFKFRAVGINPNAARVSGINVRNMYVYAMLLSGGLVGLAGVTQVTSTVTTGFTAFVDAGVGFDAITVALLGRSRPWGIFVAGILFGAFKAGGYAMQATQGVNVPVDIVLVVQSLIVLFIAAPPLVRAIFRLPDPDRAAKKKQKAAAKAVAA